MGRRSRAIVGIYVVLALAAGGLISVLVRQGPARAEPAPQGLFSGLKDIHTLLNDLIAREKKGNGLDPGQLSGLIRHIGNEKRGLVAQFFEQEQYGVKLSGVFDLLDCMDSVLSESLAYGFSDAPNMSNQTVAARLTGGTRDCRDRYPTEKKLRAASGVPKGVLADLKQLDDELTTLTREEGKGAGLDKSDLVKSVGKIRRNKLAIVDHHFNPSFYGVKFVEVFRSLDCVDANLALGFGRALSRAHGASYSHNAVVIAFEAAEICQRGIEEEFRTHSNIKPDVSAITATFYPEVPPQGQGSPCDSKNPNYGETCYSVSASDADGDTLTYDWSLAPPVQDSPPAKKPGCVKFFPPWSTMVVWHHGDADGCNHFVEGPNGHVGAVSVAVKDGYFTCVAVYLGTNDPDTTPKTGPDATCFPASEVVLTVVKAGIGLVGNSRDGAPGNGTVTSSPAGINCDTSCQIVSVGFPKDSQITLTATRDGSSTFAGWSEYGGGCSGTDSCTVTMDKDHTVMATFQHN